MASAPTTARPAGQAGGGRAATSGLAGARELTKLAVRRDRIMLPVWVYALTAISLSGGYALKLVYKTAAARASLAASVHTTPALKFLYGQFYGDSLGALIAWRYLVYAALGAALMSIFLVVRHTRADEETGRLELIGSTAVGRHAPLAVAIVVATAANLILLVLSALVLVVSGLPVTGAIAFGLAEACCGLAFAGITAVAAQVSGTARGARGIAIALLGLIFLLRGAGDSGGGHGLAWLTWLSPIGWAELVRPFAGERWWVLGLPLLTLLAGTGLAFLLAARRDQGAGLLPQRPGPATAGRLLAGPLGLSWRLQRGTLAGWAAGFLAGGLAVGVVTTSIGKLVGHTAGITKAIDKIGGQSALTNAYLAGCMSLLGLVAAGYAVSAVARLRADEEAGHDEPLLAAPVSRLRWGGSHLVTVAIGAAAVLVAGGLGVGLAYGIAISDVSTQVPRLIGAGLAQLPAALAVAAVGAAFVGLLPRWSDVAGWIALALCGFIGLFGPAMNLAQAVLDLSPFTHVPKLPGGEFSVMPLFWLSVIAVVLAGACLAGLRRRDIG
ncbi:MAG TPA: ABC transporter permease [Streptosporangiaceae bacterium]|nr:ABC transporter permease [Streptosporangiaceae bacterium]